MVSRRSLPLVGNTAHLGACQALPASYASLRPTLPVAEQLWRIVFHASRFDRPERVFAFFGRWPFQMTVDSNGDPATFVETQSLVREYRIGETTVRALDGLDLRVARGEFLAVLGVSGSGKSTLLHLLGGLDTPTAGSVRVGGQDLAALTGRGRTLYRRTVVGFVFQSYYLVPNLTAEENVALALTFQGAYGETRRRRAAEAIERLGISHRAHHRPGQLSGGEQQRVAIARAIVHHPPLLLADEPTGNLDHATAAEVIARLRQTCRELGTTLIMVTHDREMAVRFADRIIQLRDGRLVDGEVAVL
jgi:putative ABC transport system ATP-binding protein